MLNIISFVLRGLQLIFGAIVLGLSIRAIQWQRTGSAPATTSYSAFAGAFCMLVALVGIAAVWIHKLAGLIMAGIDTLASILLVAGGIAFAVGMRGIDCGNLTTEINGEEHIIDGRSRGLISGGCREDSRANDEYVCAFGGKSTEETSSPHTYINIATYTELPVLEDDEELALRLAFWSSLLLMLVLALFMCVGTAVVVYLKA
ncbi:hypothetical protein MBLNU230_g3219t1 [Neophaeotheca triangularis]